jgi:hypothetical protein
LHVGNLEELRNKLVAFADARSQLGMLGEASDRAAMLPALPPKRKSGPVVGARSARQKGAVPRGCDTRRVKSVQQSGGATAGWMAASPEQVADARRWAEAWNRGDFETWIEGFATDCEWYPSTVGAVEGGGTTAIHGHEGLRAYTRQAEEVCRDAAGGSP